MKSEGEMQCMKSEGLRITPEAEEDLDSGNPGQVS